MDSDRYVGKKCKVAWGGMPYSATIKSVSNYTVLCEANGSQIQDQIVTIGYDGWSSEHDEAIPLGSARFIESPWKLNPARDARSSSNIFAHPFIGTKCHVTFNNTVVPALIKGVNGNYVTVGYPQSFGSKINSVQLLDETLPMDSKRFVDAPWKNLTHPFVGSKCVLLYSGVPYETIVKKFSSDSVTVGYVGYGDEWDEILPLNHSRFVEAPWMSLNVNTSPMVGDSCEVRWHNTPYAATVLHVANNLVTIGYVGWGETWNETIPSTSARFVYAPWIIAKPNESLKSKKAIIYNSKHTPSKPFDRPIILENSTHYSSPPPKDSKLLSFCNSLTNDNPNMTSIKLVLGEDVRRIAVPKNITYLSLIETIGEVFKTKIVHASNVSLKYLDDEGEQCTVTSTEELSVAFFNNHQKSTVLRLEIFINLNSNSNSVSISKSFSNLNSNTNSNSNSNSNSDSISSISRSIKREDTESKYTASLQILTQMGFCNVQQNLEVLEKTKGDVTKAINVLVNK